MSDEMKKGPQPEDQNPAPQEPVMKPEDKDRAEQAETPPLNQEAQSSIPIPPQAPNPAHQGQFGGGQQPPFYTIPPTPQGVTPTTRNENIILPIISYVVSFLLLILAWVTPIPFVFLILSFLGIIFAIVSLVLNWKRKKVLSIIALVVAGFVFLMSGAATAINAFKNADNFHEKSRLSPKKDKKQADDSNQAADSDDADDEAITSNSSNVKDYIADSNAYQFKWTIKGFTDLEFSGYDARNGTDIKKVIKKFGKASNASLSDDGKRLVLEYREKSSEGRGNASLRFSKQYDGKFILSSGSLYGINTDAVKTVSRQQYKSTWTQKDMDDLKKGDSYSGEGGTGLKEVIEKHGNPTGATESIRNSGEGFIYQLELTYSSANRDDETKLDYVSLDFVRSEGSDDYLLKHKYPNFSKDKE